MTIAPLIMTRICQQRPAAWLRATAALALLVLGVSGARAADRYKLWEIVHGNCVPAQYQHGDPKPCAMVDLYSGFMTSTMLAGDGIHPNQTGYDFMGDGWYMGISSYLH